MPNTSIRVIVVGAGIAGLSAAYRLQQAGHDVRVLEAQSQVGGRMAERRDGPIAYNTGARLIYPFGRAFHALVDELGLRDALVPLRDLRATCHTEQGLAYDVELMPGMRALHTPGLTWGDRARLAASAARLLAARRRVDPDDMASALDGNGTDETLADYSKRTLGERAYRLLIEPVFRGTRSWNPEEISATFYRSTMPHLIGRHTVYTLAGGMGRLCEALAARLPVTCGAPVRRIERRAQGGCRVQTDEQAYEADIVICATEGARAAALLANPLDDEMEMLTHVRYNALGVMHYAVQGEVRGGIEFAPRRARTRIATYQQLPAMPGAGRPLAQLYCQLTPEAIDEARRDGRQQTLDMLVRDELRTRIADIDTRIVATVNQWIEYKLPVPYPGYAGRVARFLHWQAAAPRDVYFCGDYLAQALVTGACHSGEQVARQIIATRR